MKRTRPSTGEERWPERAPLTWWEAAAVTARTVGFVLMRSSSTGNPSEIAMSRGGEQSIMGA